MRWFKALVFLLIVVLAGVFLYQNIPTFKSNVPFIYNLRMIQKMEWNVSVCTLLLLSFGLGFLIGIFAMLKPYAKMRKKLAQEKKNASTVPAPVTGAGPEPSKS